MRVLFPCLSGTGHFLPLIPLARAAEAAGHEVVVASGSRIARTVRDAGLRFEEAGPPSIESVAATIPELRTLRGRAHAEGIWSHVFSGPLASGLAEGIIPPDAPLPPTARPIRPTAADDRDGQPIPSWLENGLGRARPRVAVTLGTVNSGRTDIIRPILDGLADRERDVVVALGAARETLGDVPPGVRVEEYVPMSALLPRSDVVICHGGSGTMLAALAAGIPLVIIPLAADQPDNADVCVSAGVAIAIAPAELTPARIRSAVDEVLGDGPYRQRAAAMAAEIASMPPPEAAIEQIAGLAAASRSTA